MTDVVPQIEAAQPCIGGQACDGAHRCIDPKHCDVWAAAFRATQEQEK